MLPETFWAKVFHAPKTGCWEWTGAIQSSGYGSFGVNKSGRLAHRLSYESMRGPIPEGLQIDHLCKNKVCVNPWHLEPVTHQENQARTDRATKTHCKHGHPLSGANLGKTGRGYRRCMTCNRINAARWRAKRKMEKAVEVGA